jgi:hypothetical protein
MKTVMAGTIDVSKPKMGRDLTLVEIYLVICVYGNVRREVDELHLGVIREEF